MRIFLTITVGISLMTLAGGTVAFILHDPTFGGGLILLAAWGAIAFITFFILADTFDREDQKRNRSRKNDNQSEKLSKRVKELEKRLIDLQDIVITNDDKLERLSPVKSPSPPQTISD